MSEEVTKTEGIAQSLIPYYRDGGKQASFLSYMVAGFSVMEACKLAKVHYGSVKRWRRLDPNFVKVEEQCTTELRKRLSDELLDIEFTRNFRLVLAKDFEILFKDACGTVLTEKEQQYLLTIRKFYTPQQFAMIKQLVGADGKEEAFDFTKTVLTIRLEKEEKGKRYGLPQVSEAYED